MATEKKTVTAEKAAAKKAPVRKAIETKAPAKRTAAVKPVEGGIYIQAGGLEIDVVALRAKAVADAAAKAGSAVTSLNLYVKPEDGKAYYAATAKDGDIYSDVAL